MLKRLISEACSLLLQLTPRGRVFLAKSSSADNSVLSHVLFKSHVHYRAHKIPPLVPGLSQKNPVHMRSYFFQLRCNIIVTSTSRTFKRSLSFRLEDRKSLDIYTKLREIALVL
jgi:hypothetical protein